MTAAGAALLEEYARRHDEGVRSGDFSSLASLFRPDARLLFLGVNLGPFEGREAIREAFTTWPPSSELASVSVRSSGPRSARATFGSGTEGAGSVTLTERDGEIEELVIDLR